MFFSSLFLWFQVLKVWYDKINRGENVSKVKGLLFNKNGLTITTLAKILMPYQIGDQIPTISALEQSVQVARGTIQNSLRVIEQSGALKLESRGVLGSFVVHKDLVLLMQLADMTSLVGVMPLPYSKRYEGLATGLIESVEKRFDVPISLAFMNGAKKRIDTMLSGRYDFTVTSKFAAKQAIAQGERIMIVKSFGAKSYLGSHQIVFSKKGKKKLEDGMRIGIDEASLDQEIITKRVCVGYHVILVPLAYHQIIDKLLVGDIDAAVWNGDEVRIQVEDLHVLPIDGIDEQDDTIAVVIIDEKRQELAFLLGELLDVKTTLDIQDEVMCGKRMPKY